MRRAKIPLVFLLATYYLLLATFLTGCGREREKAVDEERIAVKAARVEKGTIKDTLSFVGDIKAEDSATIFPKVTGKIVEKMVKEGDLVKEGDTLFLVDRDVVGFKFEKAPVEAPIEGVVGRIYVDRGMSIAPQTPLALIVDMNRVKVIVDVPERKLPRVIKGQRAEILVDAYPEEVFRGDVTMVSPVVDIVSRRAPVEITIPNPEHKLKPGMFARVRIITAEREDTLIIPREAVLVREGKEMVYIVDLSLCLDLRQQIYRGEAVAKIRKVETGIIAEDKVEIISGIELGDKVIIEGHLGLKDGARVRVE